MAWFVGAGCSGDPKTSVTPGGDGCSAGDLTCTNDPAHTGGDGDGDGHTVLPGDGDGNSSGDGDHTGDHDAGMSMKPPSKPGLCNPKDIVPDGCKPAMDNEDSCNGLDDDCDGQVDEGCICVPGEVQRCFGGPPGRRGVGGCEDGKQTCEGPEFGYWGPCVGGRLPSQEVCDELDNDCNGCSDEIDGCEPPLACPAPGDPRVPDGKPFSTYALKGEDFVRDVTSVESWQWKVQGTPCDQMFLRIAGSTASTENGQLSFTLSNANLQDAWLTFTLSGDYTVTMTAKLKSGATIECTWIVHVRGPGLRVELCWDTTGPTSGGAAVDLDLHLGKIGFTDQTPPYTWFGTRDCYFGDCVGEGYHVDSWGYDDSPHENCNGPGARGNFDGMCPNPRLDIDNLHLSSSYVPENINVDQPNDGDQFRVAVHYYDPVNSKETHPLVNVYCGGELLGTFGAAPNQLSGFNKGGDFTVGSNGDIWRVTDIKTHTDASGKTTGCDLTPLGKKVTLDDSSWAGD